MGLLGHKPCSSVLEEGRPPWCEVVCLKQGKKVISALESQSFALKFQDKNVNTTFGCSTFLFGQRARAASI